MMVGMLVLARGTVGMIEASTTRKPIEAAHPPGPVHHRVAVGRSAHPAGAGDMEHAGDVLADVLGQRVVVLAPAPSRSTLRSASVPNTGSASAGTMIGQPGDGLRLHRVGGGLLVELAQPVGELHREGHAAHRAHLVIGQHLDRQPEADHQALQIELVAGEVHLDQRLLPVIGRAQRHAAAPHRLPQRRREIGDPRAERAPRGLALHVDVHVGRAGSPARRTRSAAPSPNATAATATAAPRASGEIR